MKSIKTTQIDGDVSVGRNVAMGGKAEIAGNVHVGHNLKVDGWLEAVNIKDVNKGIFLTLQELREAYPNPHDGWIAGVGKSTPFTAYVGKDGDWVTTGGTINVTFDMSQYADDIAHFQEDIDNVKADVNTNKTNIETNMRDIASLRSRMDTAEDNIETLEEDNDAHHSVRFGGIVDDDITFQTIGVINVTPKEVKFSTRNGCFVVHRNSNFYKAWDTQRKYMKPYSTIPYSDKMYVCDDGLVYMYDIEAGELKQVGGSVTAKEFENLRKNVTTHGERLIGLDNKIFEINRLNDAHHSVRFGGIITGNIKLEQVGLHGDSSYQNILFSEQYGQFVLRQGAKYYNEWTSRNSYMDGLVPYSEKQFILGSSIYMYDADSGELKRVSGDEAVVNINLLCKDISIATTYTLAEAIAALTALRTQKNVDYVKAGMVITYKVAEGEWETKQLIGDMTNWTDEGSWTDFGGNLDYEEINNITIIPDFFDYRNMNTQTPNILKFEISVLDLII